MMKSIILVSIGGALGSVFRYFTSIFINKYFYTLFPLATFLVNIVGCLLIGVLLGLLDKHLVVSSELKLFFVTGFCGAYTTFSTFSLENINLLQSGNYFLALLYIVLSISLGLLAVWLGFMLGK